MVLHALRSIKKSNKVRFFRVKALDSKGRPYAKQLVKVSFRGKTYKIKTKADGIARFVPSSKLKAGKYKIKVSYKGLTNANTITVKQ